MKQAKTLKAEEIKLVLAYIATRRHAARNRAIFLTSFLSGTRAHEIAALKLALLWQIYAGMRPWGFPNHVFNDSWVVGFLEG